VGTFSAGFILAVLVGIVLLIGLPAVLLWLLLGDRRDSGQRE
jgi:hypothetical protein